ncbi:MAG: lipoyl(octanoyl) transferase LipB [Gammaproteobacteria bacterium]|jgi:lipoyl(octanoyl) transferase
MATLLARDLGRRPLRDVWATMQSFTDTRGTDTDDEVWFVEHDPVFTLGLNADRSHVLDPGDIDVVQTDRGGQVTYHGPGQLVAYVMLDLRRLGLAIRPLVESLERAVIDTVGGYGIDAQSRRDAPGVYVEGAKLAAIGLRVRRGCSYHGLALNVNMDLSPFERINPCGMERLPVTQLADLGVGKESSEVRHDLLENLSRSIGSYLDEADS